MTSTELPPHQPHCLACGDQNPGGMGLRLRSEGERVKGDVTFDRRHEGAPGFAHGGALATVLDDTLGSLLILLRVPAVTAKLEVNYRRPAFIDHPFEVEAWVIGIDGRKLHLAGELTEAGEPVAEAAGLFLKVDAEHFLRGLKNLPAGSRPPDEHFKLPW